MYHGTSGTPPNLVYAGEEGFDMRFSNQGMWGVACYFAMNSAYSNSYAFRAPNGERQMFQAKVNVGKYIEMQPDRNLKMPPAIPGTNKMYDSVKGNTGGSDVIMVYSNKKAYPEYLITYK